MARGERVVLVVKRRWGNLSVSAPRGTFPVMESPMTQSPALHARVVSTLVELATFSAPSAAQERPHVVPVNFATLATLLPLVKDRALRVRLATTPAVLQHIHVTNAPSVLPKVRQGSQRAIHAPLVHQPVSLVWFAISLLL